MTVRERTKQKRVQKAGYGRLCQQSLFRLLYCKKQHPQCCFAMSSSIKQSLILLYMAMDISIFSIKKWNGICYCSTERETKAFIENSTERKRDNHMQGLYDNDFKMLVSITNKCCNMLPGRAQNYNHATLANGEITEKIDQPQIFHTGHETEFCIIV